MSNRGKWFCVFFLCLTLLLIDVRAVVVIKMGTQAPKGSAWEQILAEMAFKWKQETQGGVQLKIYAGGVVGDEGDMIRKMRIGQLQAVAVSDAGLADIDSSAFALMIPLMFQGYDDWDFVRERINPEMEMRLADKGFTVLTWSDVGWVHFFSKQRLLTPRDLERMQLAASSTQPRTVEILRWAGFSPVPIPTSELVTGLKTGLINAFYVPVIFAEASNLYRDAPNMNGMRWAPLQGALIIRNEDWHRIPAQYQPRLGEIAREVGTRLREETREREKASLEAMIARGLTVWQPDSNALAEWKKKAEAAYPRVREQLVPAELFDRVQSLVTEYRSQHAAP
jgi:TRAP-type C4-dicarboxylate transport system substrate-binding protein